MAVSYIWAKGTREITGLPGRIHTHNKVVEKILKGELSNVIYSVAEVAGGGAPVYEVEYLGDKYVSGSTNVLLRSGSRVKLRTLSDQLIRTDECYAIPSHVFHRTDVSESISVATLVCMHSAAPGNIKIIGLDGYPDRIEFQRRRCSTIEAVGCVKSPESV